MDKITIAKDVNGKEIKRNALVRIVNNPKPNHAWLREGNTLRVVNHENRNWFGEKEHNIVFLKSKGSGLRCQQGIQDKQLLVIED
ncbi:hypothetical protein [Sporosarcina sp. P17b]|uniref:hypothetical protein n=1 Tax=Sporosarcina sp. P17b TaxID=2048260 RepID=UPI000C1627C6|nr:hypothetical protein [Sporosarcina sp. P17b]PIC72405.1 hypothetical protein CSV76_15270 [Sporosarcina sp. P17b]